MTSADQLAQQASADYVRWYQDNVSTLSDAAIERADLLAEAFTGGWLAGRQYTRTEQPAAEPAPCPFCDATIPHDQHFACVICGIEAPLELGQPMTAGRWPSWRCNDQSQDACTARVLAKFGGGFCGCDHAHQAGARLCYVCDMPIKPEGETSAANQNQ